MPLVRRGAGSLGRCDSSDAFRQATQLLSQAIAIKKGRIVRAKIRSAMMIAMVMDAGIAGAWDRHKVVSPKND